MPGAPGPRFCVAPPGLKRPILPRSMPRKLTSLPGVGVTRAIGSMGLASSLPITTIVCCEMRIVDQAVEIVHRPARNIGFFKKLHPLGCRASYKQVRKPLVDEIVIPRSRRHILEARIALLVVPADRAKVGLDARRGGRIEKVLQVEFDDDRAVDVAAGVVGDRAAPLEAAGRLVGPELAENAPQHAALPRLEGGRGNGQLADAVAAAFGDRHGAIVDRGPPQLHGRHAEAAGQLVDVESLAREEAEQPAEHRPFP